MLLQVQIIGQGNYDGYCGIPKLNLKHVVSTDDIGRLPRLLTHNRITSSFTKIHTLKQNSRRASLARTAGTWTRHCMRNCLGK